MSADHSTAVRPTLRQAQQHVAEVCGVEHTRVGHDGERHRSSASALWRHGPFELVGRAGLLDHAAENGSALN